MTSNSPLLAEQVTKSDSLELNTRLFQYKKDCLFSELTMIGNSVDKHETLKWQLRILIATFSGAFLGLCVSSKEFKNLRLPKHRLFWPILFVFLSLFFLYDCHISSLISSLGNRKKCISEYLGQLPTMDNQQLLKLEAHVDVRARFAEENPTSLSKLGETLYESVERKIEYSSFYLIIIGIWISGTLIKKTKN
jgi:hypothetical protein